MSGAMSSATTSHIRPSPQPMTSIEAFTKPSQTSTKSECTIRWTDNNALLSFTDLQRPAIERLGLIQPVGTLQQEISPNVGDGLKDQAAAVWAFESAGLAATSI